MQENVKIPEVLNYIPEIKLYPTWVPVKAYLTGNIKICRPIDIRTGKPASPSNPESWTTYLSAVDYMRKNHSIEFLGFALTKESNIFSLEFSRKPGPCDYAAINSLRLVKRFNTYTEENPTGRGLQVFGIGSLAFHTMHNRLCYLEAKGWNHIVVFTGRALNGHSMRNCQKGLIYLQKKGPLRFSYEKLLAMKAISPISEPPLGYGYAYGSTGS